MESLLVVTNSDAGGAGARQAQAAVEALRAKADVQVVPVAMPGDLDGALHLRGGRTVVVAGGDRSLHTVVSALHRRNELDDAVLALVPIGGCNDFATGIGIPCDPDEAAKAILVGMERRFDLLVDCRGDVAVNAVHVASSTHSGHSTDEHHARWLTRLAPMADHPAGFRPPGIRSAAGRLAGGRTKPLRVRIEADDTVIADFDRPVRGVGVNNGRAARESAVGAPDADPADGYADLVVSFAARGLSRMRRRMTSSGPAGPDEVMTIRARRISVVGQRFAMTADGQDTGTEQRCTWNVAPQRLRILVPLAG